MSKRLVMLWAKLCLLVYVIHISFRKIIQVIKKKWWETRICLEVGKRQELQLFLSSIFCSCCTSTPWVYFFILSLALYNVSSRTLTHAMQGLVWQMPWPPIQYLFFLLFSQHRPVYQGKTYIWHIYRFHLKKREVW